MLVSIIGFLLVILPSQHPLSLRKKTRQLIFLFIFSFTPFMASAALGKVIFPRYLLFITPPLLIMAAAATERLTSYVNVRSLQLIFIFSLLLPSIYTDFKIITDPINAPIIESDRNQYVDGFPAGWGIDEVIGYLKAEAANQQIFLGTQGTFGLMPYSFELYLWDNKNIQIRGYWPVSKVPDEVLRIATEKPTYFIYYESLEAEIPVQNNLELIKKFKKGKSDRYMYFFKVLPDKPDD